MFSNPLVIQILEYLDNHLYAKVSIKELSDLFHYNKDYLMRVFKNELHITIIEYVNQKRIFCSLGALRGKNTTILSIAFQYGFYSQEYYCEVFHQIMGVSPSDYRLFLNRSIYLDEKKYNLIQDQFVYLSYFFQKCETYKNNIPPVKEIKVLSIFKEKTHLF